MSFLHARHVTGARNFFMYFFLSSRGPRYSARLSLRGVHRLQVVGVRERERVQGPRFSLPRGRFAKGEWVSRRRYRKHVLRTQTSCLRWILADGRGAMMSGRRRGGGVEGK